MNFATSSQDSTKTSSQASSLMHVHLAVAIEKCAHLAYGILGGGKSRKDATLQECMRRECTEELRRLLGLPEEELKGVVESLIANAKPFAIWETPKGAPRPKFNVISLVPISAEFAAKLMNPTDLLNLSDVSSAFLPPEMKPYFETGEFCQLYEYLPLRYPFTQELMEKLLQKVRNLTQESSSEPTTETLSDGSRLTSVSDIAGLESEATAFGLLLQLSEDLVLQDGTVFPKGSFLVQKSDGLPQGFEAAPNQDIGSKMLNGFYQRLSSIVAGNGTDPKGKFSRGVSYAISAIANDGSKLVPITLGSTTMTVKDQVMAITSHYAKYGLTPQDLIQAFEDTVHEIANPEENSASGASALPGPSLMRTSSSSSSY
ncbi:MAG: hypothetical protein P8M67_06630 [Opitutales bacterium]|nr:hypothetical protein [Opitutales bacterium]